jgi:hypothetical protein
MLRKGPAAAAAPAPAPTPKPTPQPARATPKPFAAVTPPAPTVESRVEASADTDSVATHAAVQTPVVMAEDDAAVEDVSDDDLEPVPVPRDSARDVPQLERMLGSTDPFAEADTTHTSIDVRLPLAAAKAIEERAVAAASLSSSSLANGPSSGRASRPPPLPSVPGAPSSYQQNEPPTAPGRRMDAAGSSPPSKRSPVSDHPMLAMTDQNPPVDFSQTEREAARALADLDRRRDIPPDILSATELALDDDDDENDDVLVVDEFVEDSDEYEDVAEPSKPPGPVPG